MPPPFELLAHTADVGFRAVGRTPAELFENAALALLSFGSVEGEAASERDVEVHGDDRESLLVNWLSEVLWLFDSGTFAPARFHVEAIDGTSLRARIAGIAGLRPTWRLIVKGVTWHQIEVTERDGHWEATVYLDV